jgi:DNA-binding response OmpR family regulator
MVVDDEPDLVKLVAYHLRREGFEPVCVSNGTEALRQIVGQPISLIILDLMMPGEDGLQVCRRLRGRPETATVPIMMLTAKDEESDKVIGFGLGADDYLTKPFSVKELMARVKALLRRSVQREHEVVQMYRYGNLTLDSARHEVKLADEPIKLTAKEFSLLKFFLQNKGKVLTRELLLSSIWGYVYAASSRTVDVHIRRLRKKIPLLTTAIETITALGYKLNDD